MKTLTGVIALMLALMFGASSVAVAAEKERMAVPGAAAGKGAQDMCSQTKMKLLDLIRTAEACEKANKEGRVNNAKNCWQAFSTKPSSEWARISMNISLPTRQAGGPSGEESLVCSQGGQGGAEIYVCGYTSNGQRACCKTPEGCMLL